MRVRVASTVGEAGEAGVSVGTSETVGDGEGSGVGERDGRASVGNRVCVGDGRASVGYGVCVGNGWVGVSGGVCMGAGWDMPIAQHARIMVSSRIRVRRIDVIIARTR